MLRQALDFPTSGDNGSAALLVGSGLLLLASLFATLGSFFLVLLGGYLLLQLAVRGYYVRVLRVAASHREPLAPSFRDVGGLLRDGLVAVAIAIAYVLPSAVLFLLALGGNFASAVENPLALRDPTTIAAAETAGGLAALLGLFGLLAALYLVPGAVTLYAHRGDIRSAFDLPTVVRGTVSEDYAVGWVLTMILQSLLVPFAFVLSIVLVGFILQFFVGVAVRYVWGRSLGNALGFEPPTVDRVGITPPMGLDTVRPSTADEPAHGSIDTRRTDDGATDPMADESNR